MRRTKDGAFLTIEEIDTLGSCLHIAQENLTTKPEIATEAIDKVLNCLFAMLPDKIQEGE